ncbi:DNA-binding protein [Dactylosporangium sp. NPDC050588]|uniref:DNA-binding protein n=1 Tax=Dactylosporangium sp. NPDC050588 TaxID=3157211 RepID=UPI0034068432
MLHLPAEVAVMLQCSEWWVKEQARKRRIPFTWIGGGYRFTDEHVAAIIRAAEVLPGAVAPPAAVVPMRRPDPAPASVEPVTRLCARPPRRARQDTVAA